MVCGCGRLSRSFWNPAAASVTGVVHVLALGASRSLRITNVYSSKHALLKINPETKTKANTCQGCEKGQEVILMA